MLAIWSLVSLPFLNPACISGSSQFTYCWSLAWRILKIIFNYIIPKNNLFKRLLILRDVFCFFKRFWSSKVIRELTARKRERTWILWEKNTEFILIKCLMFQTTKLINFRQCFLSYLFINQNDFLNYSFIIHFYEPSVWGFVFSYTFFALQHGCICFGAHIYFSFKEVPWKK